MRKLCALFLFFVPHPFNGFLRRLMGQNVSPKARIHIFSLIICDKLSVGSATTISPLTFIKANEISIGDEAHIAPFMITNAPLIEGANLKIGNFSRIFPFCWLEPGEGITIGNQVGIGGHTLIFTHGVWSNYLIGGPVSFGPVIIEDNVWLPWRVFIMPNVTIGHDSIIGANSTVTRNIPPHSLAAGSPAKVVKDNVNSGLTSEEFAQRCQDIMAAYSHYCQRAHSNCDLTADEVAFTDGNNSWGNAKKILINVENFHAEARNGFSAEQFISFLRRYGIRVSKCP